MSSSSLKAGEATLLCLEVPFRHTFRWAPRARDGVAESGLTIFIDSHPQERRKCSTLPTPPATGVSLVPLWRSGMDSRGPATRRAFAKDGGYELPTAAERQGGGLN